MSSTTVSVYQTSFTAFHVLIVVLIVLLGVWEAVWKGIALWRAGVDRNRVWFVLLFVLNTVGILEIVYIFAVSRPKRARERGELPPAP